MSQHTINRREMLTAALAAGALPAIQNRSAAQENKPLRNVLLIIADDHGLDMPCYGNSVIKTPNLERLAAEGIRFTNAFCTTASCSASRSVIMTGLFNHRNGQYGHVHSYNHFSTLPWVQTLPRLLKDHGYTTGIIGKFHVSPEDLYPFDANYTGQRAIGSSRNGARMAERAKEFFEATQGAPFYLHIGFADPHRAGKGFANENAYPEIEPVTYKPEDVIVPPFLPDTPECREELAEYYQAVSRMDQGIGKILKALKDTGRDKDTLIIYISDNGIPWPGAKTNCYDPSLHMPTIVRSPDQTKRGGVNNAMIAFPDLVPTILEWTGAPGPDYELDGRSFLPVLEEEDPAGWDEVYFSHTFHEITMYYPMRGVRTRRYRYINNLAHQLPYPFASDLFASKTWQGVLTRGDTMYGKRTVDAYLHRPPEELYDLQNDPDESINLADNPAYKTVLDEMRSKTQAFRERTKDPWLILQNYADPYRGHG